ncbi:MAG TPA: hypothetical protein VHN59_11700 [Chitinophagaceae bacterium]|nr:hypothetical protein [Chitinophagaceae bacterium]
MLELQQCFHNTIAAGQHLVASVEIDSRTLNRLQDIQKLNEHDKATVFEMVDAFLRDRKAKKAYAP